MTAKKNSDDIIQRGESREKLLRTYLDAAEFFLRNSQKNKKDFDETVEQLIDTTEFFLETLREVKNYI